MVAHSINFLYLDYTKIFSLPSILIAYWFFFMGTSTPFYIHSQMFEPQKNKWGCFLVNFSLTLNFSYSPIQKLYFYVTKFEEQPQARKILRPTSQGPPLPEFKHNSMLLWMAEKTSPIVDSRPKVLISNEIYGIFNLSIVTCVKTC